MTRRNWMGAVAGASMAAVSCHKTSPRYQGFALIANHDSKTIAVIDLSRFQLLKSIALPFSPTWVLAAPAHSRAFVLGSDSASMGLLDLDRLEIEKQVTLDGKPQTAGLTPDQHSLWVALREPNRMELFSVQAGVSMGRWGTPSRVEGLDVKDDQIAVTLPDVRMAGVLVRGQTRFKFSPRLSGSPGLVRFRSDEKVVLTGSPEDRSLTALDASTMQPLVQLPLPIAPRFLCVNADGGQMFVTGEGMDAVVIVSPFQTEVSETILAGRAPGEVTATTGGPGYLFVANPQSGDVTVIDIDSRRPVAQVLVGLSPGSILLTPDNEYALVLNEQSGDVAVIRLLSIRQANLTSRRNRTAPLFTMIAVGSKPVSGAIAPRPA